MRHASIVLCLLALTACVPPPDDDDPVADADPADVISPDMAPDDPDMAPDDPDMAPDDPDMAPDDPDMAPDDPDMAPDEPDMAPDEPDMAPDDPDMALPDPDMAPPMNCAAGDRRDVACGINQRGALPQLCVADAWIDEGPCADPDVCRDGAEESGPCGPDDVGLSTRSCVAGRWGPLGECVLPGVCEVGEEDEIGCGFNGRGVSIRGCVDGRWGPPGPCDDPDICRDGSDEEQACGINGRGVQLRDCINGQWGAFPPCDDLDVCEDGAAEERACGLNGRGLEARTCIAGQWAPFERCADPDRCVDGAVEREPCGLNGRGTRSRTCVRGDFAQPEDCVDGDECVDGARDERACGAQGDGVEFRICDVGEWLDWSVCGGACADTCPEGGRRCGPGGVEVCGDSDDDPCLEWGPAVACAPGAVCIDGACEAPAAPIVINEVLYDQVGGDGGATFIELWGPPGASVDGLRLVGVNGNGGADYADMPLDGVIGPDGYYIVAEPGADAALIALADLLIDGADLQNGPDGLQLRRGDLVLDALGYGDAGEHFAGEGRAATDPADGSALTRIDHVDSDDNAADFIVAPATPRAEPGDVPPECGAGETQSQACGINGRGERIRGCVDGVWGVFGPCDDPDTCVDGALFTPRLCTLDPDAGTCAGRYRPAPTCGINGWAMTTGRCVAGQPEDPPCADPVGCVPGTVGTEPCGRNGDGSRERACIDGAWAPFGGCRDPDVCDDDDTREVACGPDGGGLRIETCRDGQWAAALDCVAAEPAAIHGYVERSYAAYAILRTTLLPDEQLQDAGLDRRVSGFVVAGRPYATLADLSAVQSVVPATFDLLWAEAQARGWVPACGDGVVMPVEEACDDGNDVDGDGCDSACRLETECGDGVVEGVEQCDDGDVGAFDGCSPDCRLELHPTLGRDGDGGAIDAPILPYRAARFDLFPAQRGFFELDLRQTSRVRFDFGYPIPRSFWYGGDACPRYSSGFESRDLTMALTARYEGRQRGSGNLNCPAQGGEVEFDEVLPPGKHVMSLDWTDDRFSDAVTIYVSGRIEPLQAEVCGDGIREGVEECDDGNTTERDGCSAGCTRQTITEVNDSIDRDAVAEWQSPGAILRATGTISEGGPFRDRDHFIFQSTGGRTVIQLSDREGGDCDVDAQLILYTGRRGDADDRITSSVDGGINFCPRIVRTLAAGTYSVVATLSPPDRGGPYALEVRTSPLAWDDDVPAACQGWCLATTDCAPLSQDELAQCTAACTVGTLPADDMLRIRDTEQCLLLAGDRCADLRACAADAEPVDGCDAVCGEMALCGAPAAECADACDPAAVICGDVARRLDGGCAEVSPCVGEAVEHTDCAVWCDARIKCDPDVDRFACEQACAAAPGAAARRACSERASCEQQARCAELDDAVPAPCVAACAEVEGCGLFADGAACESYCAGQARLIGEGYLDATPACIGEVAACGFDMIHCFAPPLCEGESAPVEVIDLAPGTLEVELTVTSAGIEDDFPPFCGFRGSIEHIVALRLDFPAEITVENHGDRPAQFFLADRCDPEGPVSCGFDGDDTIRRLLSPGTYYLGAEQNAQAGGFDADLMVHVRPLDVIVIP